MHFLKFFPLFIFLYFLSVTHAATFDITNRCTYSVWAAASPGGGKRLDSGQTWNLNVNPGTAMGRIWGRTNCIFDGSGRGSCETGDCNGRLQCQGFGSVPNTLAEFALNQPNNLDFVDISLVDGFNIPMEFSPINGGCRNLLCDAPINDQCPSELRAPEAQAYTTIDIQNNCPFTVWAAAVPGGGRQLEYGETWKIEVNTTKNCRIWGRTNCNFNTLGHGQCQTGDCNGLLECQAYGTPPNTLAEYAINQFNNNDFLGISLVDGFNIPMESSPVSADECSVRIRCTADIIGQCPNELRTPGGCNNPSAVPRGGRRLEYGDTWKIEPDTTASSTKKGRIWGRTNCNFDTSGRGQCQTGDCNGLLECQTFSSTPNTPKHFGRISLEPIQ
ncbi:hypothetical protein RDI58_028509 [Solanum bulbocastanum]|uniref:Thaumatin-like protein n=1 Tax=Solanum bulbocastanum TaxID=147425 RepID=A0AAN8SWI0_SOLBU